MNEIKRNVRLMVNVGIFVAIIWAVYIINILTPFIDFNQYGIIPRTEKGLLGIICSPFLHASIFHIASNTIPLFVLSFLLFRFHKRTAPKAIMSLVLISGALVWGFARTGCHIGASSLIYGLATLIIISGIRSKKLINTILSLVVLVMYGGMMFRIFPTHFQVSWEGHLAGIVAGIFVSYLLFKKSKRF
jgi:membrane associated rhomboid family serine protease